MSEQVELEEYEAPPKQVSKYIKVADRVKSFDDFVEKGSPKPKTNAKGVLHTPRKVDASLIEDLASIYCTVEEIASIVGCHRQHIYRRYQDNLDRGRQRGKEKLRRQQWKAAFKGNPAMLIWLGKNILNQKEVPIEEENFSGKLAELLDVMKSIKSKDPEEKLEEGLEEDAKSVADLIPAEE